MSGIARRIPPVPHRDAQLDLRPPQGFPVFPVKRLPISIFSLKKGWDGAGFKGEVLSPSGASSVHPCGARSICALDESTGEWVSQCLRLPPKDGGLRREFRFNGIRS